MKPVKTEILYGVHPVAEALKAGRRRFDAIYLLHEKNPSQIHPVAKTAQALNIQVQPLSRGQLQSLTGTDTHQGVAARVSPYPVSSFSEITETPGADPPLYLLIDNVVDPHNLGALIRTALCAGITGVIIPLDRSAAPSPIVSKTSAGALEHIRLARVTNMVGAIKDLKKIDTWIIGLDKQADQSIYATDFTAGCALVIGGEESGIRPLVKKNCDMLRFIPQTGPVDSLNASVAGGIAMYEAYRQRMKNKA
jgi:23S rRNA (guanosine2251-2'-O)-methyltransferase